MELDSRKGSECADLEDQWPDFDYLLAVVCSINKERTSKQFSVQAAQDGTMPHWGQKMWFLNDGSGSSHLWSQPQSSSLQTEEIFKEETPQQLLSQLCRPWPGTSPDPATQLPDCNKFELALADEQSGFV